MDIGGALAGWPGLRFCAQWNAGEGRGMTQEQLDGVTFLDGAVEGGEL